MHSFTVQQLEVLKALSSGLSTSATAAAIGIHRTTIHHWCRTIPEFRDALEAAKQARIDAVRDEMYALAAPSLAILKHTLQDESASPSLRIRTALAIIKFVATHEKPNTRKEPGPEAEIHHISSLLNSESEETQTPRNADCPCGSKLKYKRCCGRNAPPVLSRAA